VCRRVKRHPVRPRRRPLRSWFSRPSHPPLFDAFTRKQLHQFQKSGRRDRVIDWNPLLVLHAQRGVPAPLIWTHWAGKARARTDRRRMKLTCRKPGRVDDVETVIGDTTHRQQQQQHQQLRYQHARWRAMLALYVVNNNRCRYPARNWIVFIVLRRVSGRDGVRLIAHPSAMSSHVRQHTDADTVTMPTVRHILNRSRARLLVCHRTKQNRHSVPKVCPSFCFFE